MAENEPNEQTTEAPSESLGEAIGVAIAEPGAPDDAPALRREPKPADKHGWWWGTGRRKTAVARVRMRSAKPDAAGLKIQASNKRFRTIEEYFSEIRDRDDCYAPLKLTNTSDQFEVIIRLKGGGPTGQAQAVRLGVARALRDFDPNFEHPLRVKGMLTRDARKVERKKYGQPGARKRFQFSKR